MRMIDKAMRKYGYIKTRENQYGVYYEKREPQGFDHVVCVLCKASGRHIMQSYDAEVHEVNCDLINCVCGAEIPVLLLMWLKAKYLAVKYRWEKDGDGNA